MPKKTMDLKPQFRDLELKSFDEEKKTVSLSFSSEDPYERYWGIEILDHSTTSVNMERLNNSAPLLFNHNRDEVIGVVEFAKVENSRGIAVVRFGNSEKAKEVFSDVVDGIMKNVSVGYQIDEMKLEGEKDGVETYRVTGWQPFEISIVSIPADNTVGVGRSTEGLKECEVKILNQKKEAIMPKEKQEVDVSAVQAEARTAERTRVRDIGAIGAKFKQTDLANTAIEAGTTADEFRTMVLEKLGSVKPVDTKSAEIDMNEKELQGYSFARALKAAVSGNWAGAEAEKAASDKVAKMLGKDARGFYVPHQILKREITTTSGASTVDTTTGGASFIDILRNKLMLLKLGGQVLSGLSGNVAIPKQTGSATAYWIAEGATTTASDLALGMLELSPKTVSAKSGYTRNMLLQGNPSIEALVMNDLAAGIALAIDKAGFAGTGANGQPLGILNTTGIGAVDSSAAAGGLTNDVVVDLETAIASGNADVDNMNYVAGAVVTGKLKKKAIEAGQTAKLLANGEVNGYKHNRTNQVPANTIVFGDFSQVITALWGGLDIMIDQYSNADTGGVVVRAFQSVDVGVRYPEAFSATTNIDL
jgi:HK97 family phage major capsid protein/HK97 family phage prohead protease